MRHLDRRKCSWRASELYCPQDVGALKTPNAVVAIVIVSVIIVVVVVMSAAKDSETPHTTPDCFLPPTSQPAAGVAALVASCSGSPLTETKDTALVLPLPASVPSLRVTIQAQARSLELGCKNRGKAEAAIDECLPNRRPEVLRKAAAASPLTPFSLSLSLRLFSCPDLHSIRQMGSGRSESLVRAFRRSIGGNSGQDHCPRQWIEIARRV